MAVEDRAIYRVVSAEISRDGKYLISQRSMKAVLPLLWEFPEAAYAMVNRMPTFF